MSQIAIIDDNIEQCGTLKKTLDYYLKRYGSKVTVICQFPFSNIDNYFDFINENDICLLILDERLNDQVSNDGSHVNYRGNELVVSLREKLKDFPIVMITTYSNDEELRQRENEFEYLLNRNEITESADIHIPRMIRSAQRFLDSNNEELSEFNKLTIQIASGDTSPDLLKRLEALQVKLELPMTGFDDRSIWLEQYEKHIKELQALKKELEQKLEGE